MAKSTKNAGDENPVGKCKDKGRHNEEVLSETLYVRIALLLENLTMAGTGRMGLSRQCSPDHVEVISNS